MSKQGTQDRRIETVKEGWKRIAKLTQPDAAADHVGGYDDAHGVDDGVTNNVAATDGIVHIPAEVIDRFAQETPSPPPATTAAPPPCSDWAT